MWILATMSRNHSSGVFFLRSWESHWSSYIWRAGNIFLDQLLLHPSCKKLKLLQDNLLQGHHWKEHWRKTLGKVPQEKGDSASCVRRDAEYGLCACVVTTMFAKSISRWFAAPATPAKSSHQSVQSCSNLCHCYSALNFLTILFVNVCCFLFIQIKMLFSSENCPHYNVLNAPSLWKSL